MSGFSALVFQDKADGKMREMCLVSSGRVLVRTPTPAEPQTPKGAFSYYVYYTSALREGVGEDTNTGGKGLSLIAGQCSMTKRESVKEMERFAQFRSCFSLVKEHVSFHNAVLVIEVQFQNIGFYLRTGAVCWV